NDMRGKVTEISMISLGKLGLLVADDLGVGVETFMAGLVNKALLAAEGLEVGAETFLMAWLAENMLTADAEAEDFIEAADDLGVGVETFF
ncbi:hypothetical protein C0993_003117, partial [Termitomyces sp. T159_Od127]